MEIEEDLDKIFFDLKHFLPEIYSFHQVSDSDNGTRKLANKKQSMSCNSCSADEILSTKPSSSSAAASPPPLISFGNSKFSSFSPTKFSDRVRDHSNLDELLNDYSLTSQMIKFSTSDEDDHGKKPATRTPLQAQEHLMAERKRRENLRKLFVDLSKVVPGLKKLDKASQLEDAIEYLKALQERVRVLEEEEIENNSIDTSKNHSCLHKEASIDNSTGITCESTGAPEIQARISDKHVLVKIFCKKQMDFMSRIPGEMEKIHLNVVDIRIMPFGGAALVIAILAEMQSEFRGAGEDIVDHLQTVFLNPRSKVMQDDHH